jgi:hypothetical protein
MENDDETELQPGGQDGIEIHDVVPPLELLGAADHVEQRLSFFLGHEGERPLHGAG